MKIIQRYKTTGIMAFLVIFGAFVTSCSFDEQVDPNRPSLEGVLTDASQNQLNNLVVGIESAM